MNRLKLSSLLDSPVTKRHENTRKNRPHSAPHRHTLLDEEDERLHAWFLRDRRETYQRNALRKLRAIPGIAALFDGWGDGRLARFYSGEACRLSVRHR